MQNSEPEIILKSEAVSKTFGKNIALEDISFEIKKGEFVGLLGPSGSGKTTLLRIMVGLEYPNKGKIFVAGKLVSSPLFCEPPHKRNIGMVFQDLSLWPHMNVREHILFALSGIKLKHSQKEERLSRILETVNLQRYGDRYPYQLSGGEKQRLALGRALAGEPKMLLLDEPLSNLDLDLKTDLQKMLIRLNQEKKITVVYVTHDQVEAMLLSERTILLNNGRVEQIDSPSKLIENPKSDFVKNFIKFEAADIAKMRKKLLWSER